MNNPSETPKLSILIPTYLQAEYLPDTIESVLRQSYKDFELVIADDASPDRTEQVVRRYQDPRIRYCPSRSNLGRVANYRRALYDLARGRYATNLDGDDLLGDANYLSTAVDLLDQSPRVSLVCGSVIRFVGAPPQLSEVPSSGRVEYVDGTAHFLNYWRRDRSIHHLGSVYRVAQAREIGFYRRNIISADTESLIRLLPGNTISRVDRVAGMWRGHEGNASVGISVAAALDNIRLVDSVYGDTRVQARVTSAELRRWRDRMLRARIYGSSTTHFFLKSRCKAGWTFLRRAFRAYPGSVSKVLSDPRLWLHVLACALRRGPTK